MLLPLLLLATTAHAESIKLVPCVAPVKPGDTATSVLFERQRFTCGEAQAHFTPGDYWVRMDVPDAPLAAREVIMFRAASLWDDGIVITTFDAKGAMRNFAADPKAKPSPMRLGSALAIPIHMHGAPVRAIVARVENSQVVRGVMHRPSLASPHTAREQELVLAALYAAFAGICIGLLFYNAALWWAMRQPFLLAYCSMVAAMLAYSLFTSGAPHYFIDGWTGGDRLRVTIPLLAISASVGMWFISSFFTATTPPRWLRLATYAQMTLLTSVSLAYATIGHSNIKLFDTLYMFSFVPLPLLFLCYLNAAWRNRDPLLPYFIVAWSLPFLSVLMRILRGFDVVPPTAVIENSTLIGLAFEALVSSLAIGYRVRLLAQDRDRAALAEAHAVAIAETDPLTGLLNRRAFLSRLLERKSNWTLLLLDIDHFKRVNDSLGHAGGDEALMAIGQMLRREAPGGALVARMGGEEFAIAYRGDMLLIDPAELLTQIRNVELPDGYRITASIGIANRAVENEHDWKILYRAADMALYRAKSGGRDCFIHVPATMRAAA